MNHLTLNDGRSIPQLGFGTWKITDEDSAPLVKKAIETGYRHIDTAAIYGNEAGVGLGLRQSGVDREELFVTTKLWNDDHGDPAAALRTSLDKLGLEYVDLYLIHWPVPEQNLYASAWKTLVTLREQGLAKSIGVSNFYAETLDDLQDSGVVPAVNQVEIHPTFANRATIEANTARGIVTESWSPLGRAVDLDIPILELIAARVGASVAQVILAWHLAKNFVVIPKTVSPARMRENLETLDLVLTDSDLAAIDALDRGNRTGSDPRGTVPRPTPSSA
jgi:2,5-diketo-D-gluconate reductase A